MRSYAGRRSHHHLVHAQADPVAASAPTGGEKTHFRDRADRGMQLSAFVAVDPARLINRIDRRPRGLSWLGIRRSRPGCRLHATGRAV